MENETKVIVGTSEEVEAEYGMNIGGEWTVLLLFNNEPVSIESFDSREDAMNCETVTSIFGDVDLIIL